MNEESKDKKSETPINKSKLNDRVIKQIFQAEIKASEEEVKMWVSRDNWRAATEAKDKLKGIEHILMKLQYNRIAL